MNTFLKILHWFGIYLHSNTEYLKAIDDMADWKYKAYKLALEPGDLETMNIRLEIELTYRVKDAIWQSIVSELKTKAEM